MSGSNTPPTPDLAAALTTALENLKHIGDAVFSTKNALVSAITANTTAVNNLLGHLTSAPTGAVTIGTGAAPAPAQQADPPPPAPPAVSIPTGQTAITVGPTQPLKEPVDALPYLAPGAVLTLEDGTYIKPMHNTVDGLTIKSASGNPRACIMDGQGGHGAGHDMAYHKGMIHSSLPIAVVGIGFERCGSIAGTDIYSNEAAIWLGDNGSSTPWNCSVLGCAFDDCGNGIFSAEEQGLDLTVRGNVFGARKPNGMNAAAAGLGPHAAHDIYFHGAAIHVTGNWFFGGAGHAVKTRSPKTEIIDNPLMCSDGGRVVDACEGGTVLFTGNKVWTRTDRQGQSVGSNTGAFGNSNLIGYALENTNHGTPGFISSGNLYQISRTGATIAAGNGSTITSTGDTVQYYESGSLVLQGNVSGLTQASAMPGAGSEPTLPAAPF